MQSQTPIFDKLVAEFSEDNKHYIDLIGGIKPGMEEDLYIKPNAQPLGWNGADDITQVLDLSPIRDVEEVAPPIPEGEPEKKSGVYPRHEKDDTAAQTETPASPDDSA